MTSSAKYQHSDIFDAVVVGAGLTGLALALSLAEEGISVAIMDQREGISSDRIRSTTINQASYDTLHKLGVIERFLAQGYALTPIQHIRVSDEKTRKRARLNVKDQLMEWHDDNGPLAWVFRNHDMETILHQSCLDHPNITIHPKVTVTDFTPRHPQWGNVAAAIYTEDGAIHAARLVIAADGGGSPLRQAAGISSIPRDPKQTAIVVDVRTALPHQNIAWQRFLKGGPSALMPVDDDRLMALVWTMPNQEAEVLLSADDVSFNNAMMASFGDGFGGLTAEGQKLSWRLKLNHVLKPYGERVVLAGDAAHAIHPLAGQGYNLALGDARAIAAVMASALQTGTDIGARTVVQKFAKKRIAETTAMTIATDGLNALFSFGGDKAVGTAGMAMTLLNATPLKSIALKIASGKFTRRG